MFVVMLSQMSPAISTRQASEAGAIAFLLLMLFCPAVMFVTSWTQAKQRFAMTSDAASHLAMSSTATSAPTSAVREASRVATTRSDKTVTSRRSAKTTWWKRLFTVLEITVLLISIVLAAVLYANLPPSDSVWLLISLVVLPVLVVRSIRIGLIYIVEGTKPFQR
jgi:hypothetical protein